MKYKCLVEMETDSGKQICGDEYEELDDLTMHICFGHGLVEEIE